MEENRECDFLFCSYDPAKQIADYPENKNVNTKIELTELATSLRNKLNSTGLPRWDITIEGYLEASGFSSHDGIARFKTILKLSQA